MEKLALLLPKFKPRTFWLDDTMFGILGYFAWFILQNLENKYTSVKLSFLVHSHASQQYKRRIVTQIDYRAFLEQA